MNNVIVLIIIISFSLFSQPASARHQLQVDSTYLGDGWFQYRVTVINDPFFEYFTLTDFTVLNFTNYMEAAPSPAQWYQVTNSEPFWRYDTNNSPVHQLRPYERVFRIRSSNTHYRRANTVGDALFLLNLATIGGFHGDSKIQTTAFCRVRALVPCSAQEADGTPTNFVGVLDFNIPDVKIENLTKVGEDIVGLVFTYDEPSTLYLEGSFDLVSWRKVNYLYGNKGTTTWTTNQPLNQYGSFFRLGLVAEGHATNLPPLVTNASLKAKP